MELPKNITQIGEADRNCKVYVEDYVTSYIKQMNLPARDKDMAVALYGIRKEENEVSYIFLYGACKLDFLQKESRRLSQAQYQEIEKLRKKYFAEYSFLGYRLLNGEMVEGFHICDQGVCRYVQGYARFYEKNDSMLAYMLDTRQGEAAPEEVNLEKYDAVRKRQEERRAQAEEKSVRAETGDVQSAVPERRAAAEKPNPLVKKYRFSTVAVFAILCVAGLASLNENGSIDGLKIAAKQMIEEMSQQKLPDDEEADNMVSQIDSLVAEDKLAEAVRKENENLPVHSTDIVTIQGEPSQPGTINIEESDEGQEEASDDKTAEPDNRAEEAVPEQSDTTVSDANAEATEVIASPIGYVIQKGDTLIGISIRQYGTDTRVSEICSLNNISNPDDIKIGQKILLP